MADNYDIRDAASATRTFRATDNAAVMSPHHILETLEGGVPTPVSSGAPLPVSIPAELIDSFSRMRTSDPAYRFDSQFTYQIDDDLWDVLETGDGSVSHDATNRCAIVSAGATAGANSAILQSHYHSPYTPGRGQLPIITFSIPDPIPTNGEVGVGYYDGSNGIYLKKDASGLTINLETTTDASDESIAQASWNIDPLDGTGPSGITIDTTMGNIFLPPFQALYVGLVVCAFDIDGRIAPFHAFYNANNKAYPYIAQASLPVRYWASTSTDASAATINAICSTVISEGGEDLQDIPGRPFVAKGTVENAASGTVLVIRPKQQLNGINQNALTMPTGIDISVQDAGCWVEIRRNATVTAGTFEDVDPLSTVEVSYAGNAGTDPAVTAGTGHLVDTLWIPASASIRTLADTSLLGKVVLAYSHLLGAADNLAVIYNTGGGTTDVRCALKWKEIR